MRMRSFGARRLLRVLQELLKPLVLLLQLALLVLEAVEFRFPQGCWSTLFNCIKIFFSELELLV